MSPKTDYFLHEERYRERRVAGATGWDDPDQLAEHVEELERYAACDSVPRAGRLIELGCGAGEITLLHAKRGYQVTGVDISPTAIAWAREKAMAEGLQADFRVADVVDPGLELGLGTFDIVLDGHCLHCIVGDDRRRFFASVRRLLRPRGVLLVGTMCGEVTSQRILAAFDPESRYYYRDDVATRYIGDPEAIVAEIEAAGFEIVKREICSRRSRDDQDMLLVVARLRA